MLLQTVHLSLFEKSCEEKWSFDGPKRNIAEPGTMTRFALRLDLLFPQVRICGSLKEYSLTHHSRKYNFSVRFSPFFQKQETPYISLFKTSKKKKKGFLVQVSDKKPEKVLAVLQTAIILTLLQSALRQLASMELKI